MKIIDNFLDEGDHIILKDILMSNTFPWFFNHSKIKGSKDLFDFQFTHIFYADNQINSNYFNCVESLLNKINPHALVRIKANLNVMSHKQVIYKKHKDQEFKCKAAIYYVNTNDGYTLFKNKKINSVENRIVLFNSDEMHSSTNTTNSKSRIVINFNYF